AVSQIAHRAQDASQIYVPDFSIWREQGYFVLSIPSRGTAAVSISFAVARSAAVAAILSSRARGFGRSRGVFFGTGFFPLVCVPDLHDCSPVTFWRPARPPRGIRNPRAGGKRMAWGDISTVQKRGRC